jgi:chemotaxis response regulator CheB
VSTQRVLVCEDSPVYAAALIRLLEKDGDIKVSAVCTTAAEAIAALPRVQPDLVTMDLELPDMNGLKAVEEIMSSRPLPILVLSGLVGMESGMSASALALGALDAIAKDGIGLRDPDPVPGDRNPPSAGRAEGPAGARRAGADAPRVGHRGVRVHGRPAGPGPRAQRAPG